jgi:hypothetical protein
MPESSAVLALWKSNVPRYFATMGQDTTTQMSVNWYLPGGNTPTWTYSEYTSGTLPADTVFSFTSFFAGGDSVYWVRQLTDTSGNVLGTTGLYTASVSSGSRAQLAGGATLGTMTIVDASSQSLLLKDNAGNIYRIPLPLGLGTSAPTKITTVVMTSTTGYFQGIVEDANGIYWLDGEGTVYRCSASNCEGTKSVLANGQVASGAGIGFIQDATALYWGITDTDRIMRLAK